VRWLYKIWSGWDDKFRPSEIPHRLFPGGELSLGWAKYADVAEPGDDVWVWFYEGNRFPAGVYVKGIVESVDPAAQQLILQTQVWSSTSPLTTPAENELLAQVVAPRGRQVFVLPDDFRRFDDCTATSPGATSCRSQNCDHCTYWRDLPTVEPDQVRTPALLDSEVAAFAPAFWVIANRSFAWSHSDRVLPGVRATTNMFYRFKTGEGGLAYPLGLGMLRSLARNNAIEADAILPIPLSPEKAAAGEIHRTRALASALGQLIHVPVVQALALEAPIGKRAAQQAGQTFMQFRHSTTPCLLSMSMRSGPCGGSSWSTMCARTGILSRRRLMPFVPATSPQRSSLAPPVK
jgi:hypothetical protein